jgi:hypothetical protein
MKYGRVDVTGPTECPEEGRLPGKRIMNTNCGTLPLKLVPTLIILSKKNLCPSSTPKEIKSVNLSWLALILFHKSTRGLHASSKIHLPLPLHTLHQEQVLKTMFLLIESAIAIYPTGLG